jgi:N6-adenosine-specific RNA methylase IME4
MNELIKIESNPKVPKIWDYEKSVKKVKGLIFKWRNLTEELFGELYIAREKLSKEGRNWNKSSIEKTWSDYCEDIGSSRQVVNRWLARYDLNRKTKELPPPKGVSQVIYADPPWDYANSGLDQSARKHYQTIPTVYLCNPEAWLKIPIQKIIGDRSVLFLWVTYPFAKEGLQICEAWGFHYKAQLVWVKNTTTGMGWFVTPKHELLYIAVRGQELHPAIKPESVFYFATHGHSRKPQEVYEMIESMYTGPYIELFARQKRENWQSWGDGLD